MRSKSKKIKKLLIHKNLKIYLFQIKLTLSNLIKIKIYNIILHKNSLKKKINCIIKTHKFYKILYKRKTHFKLRSQHKK